MYVKLFDTLLDSSIWGEDHATVRVWITMLLMADEFGIVRASTGGVARRARVEHNECRRALQKFQEPDPESKNQDYGGRRIEQVDGGWQILNYEYYRGLQTNKQRADAARQRKHRADKGSRDVTACHSDVTDCHTESAAVQTEAEAEAEADKRSGADAPTTKHEFVASYSGLIRKVWPEQTRQEMATNASILGHMFGKVSGELDAAISGLPIARPNTRPSMRLLWSKEIRDEVWTDSVRAHYQSLKEPRQRAGEDRGVEHISETLARLSQARAS